MRFSLYRSACTSAVALTLMALPCLAEPADSFTLQIPAQHASVTCKDPSHLKACIDAQSQLSAKEKAELTRALPSMKQQIEQGLAKQEASSHACLTLRMYQYPQGYPETGAHAKPKVSVCQSAASAREKMLQMQKPQR
ncbi:MULTISPECIES: hypothetical protein [Acidobacterium]|uniref:Lipoprotein n=1 Tax=Acidobacterium capsulatum (strain ATCC 51196 / DSM 11244 / BCRC 80197 / JCM 7670 / NBRC 15755 / NCIMB 13165 / 161) TaxID=240015 RepID=C1F8X2_ACIC5|nr:MULTISPECIES: hypothetical protein [Acidobacterium]ACO32962.1 hypothetical protein ACP_2031 [Acidobacterium capsulatum ATCC 51196]HCT59894.1 hypothetical protein [Acidobacterium sp.]